MPVERVENASSPDGRPTGDDPLGMSSDYANQNRVIWQKPELVMQILGDLSQKTVADIGAGTGFFSFRLAPRVKKVIAIDIDPRAIAMIDSSQQRMPSDLRGHLEARLAQVDNPMLKPDEADAAIIVNTYMYIENRVAYLRTLRQGMKRGGTVVIIDFKDKLTDIGPPADARIPLTVVESELNQAGYRVVRSDDTSLDFQYVVTAVTN